MEDWRMAFSNEQWNVSDYGIEAIPGSQTAAMQGLTPPYEISAKRLLETTDRDRVYYDWPVHMAEKTWVDVEAFLEAFANALDEHRGKYSGAVSAGMLELSFRKARQIAATGR
jgi:hypothetical protein